MIRAIFVVGSAAIAPQSEVIRAVFVLKRQQERKERHQSLAEWHGSRSARKDSVSHPAAGHPAGVEDRRFPRGPPRVELFWNRRMVIRATHQEGSLCLLHGLSGATAPRRPPPTLVYAATRFHPPTILYAADIGYPPDEWP